MECSKSAKRSCLRVRRWAILSSGYLSISRTSDRQALRLLSGENKQNRRFPFILCTNGGSSIPLLYTPFLQADFRFRRDHGGGVSKMRCCFHTVILMVHVPDAASSFRESSVSRSRKLSSSKHIHPIEQWQRTSRTILSLLLAEQATGVGKLHSPMASRTSIRPSTWSGGGRKSGHSSG